MLTRLTESETARYGHWAYALAMRGETASYPSYRDGIKTWEDFIRPDDSPDAEALLFRHEGRVCGWIAWYAIPAQRYAATSAFLVETYADDAAREFVAHVRALMTACLNDLKRDGSHHMTFFAEEEAALPILTELGFRRVGAYRAYRKAL